MNDIYSRLLDATRSGSLDSRFLADLMPAWASSKIRWSRLSGPKRQTLVNWEELRCPGIYVWLTTRDLDGREKDADGRELLVPRKVGQTGWNEQRKVPSSDKQNLRKRMLDRYVEGPREGKKDNQVPLAVEYRNRILDRVGDCSNRRYRERMDAIQEKGLRAFPPEVLDAYNKSHPWSRPNARYKAAVDWALHGGSDLANLFVVVAPMVLADAKDLPVVEKALQSAADAWNRKRGLPSLYNA